MCRRIGSRIRKTTRMAKQLFSVVTVLLSSVVLGELVLSFLKEVQVTSTMRQKEAQADTHNILRNLQDSISAMTGSSYTGKNSDIGHRIVLFLDFASTPSNAQNDQRFDGHILIQTVKESRKKVMAGTTWWDQITFCFYAIHFYDVPG